MRRINWKMVLAGICAGGINGLFGAGGGMVLVPLLAALGLYEGKKLFSASISIILPICCVSLVVTALTEGLDTNGVLPYLLGGFTGGLLAGKFGKEIPTAWLHKGLGIMILCGGIRYLW